MIKNVIKLFAIACLSLLVASCGSNSNSNSNSNPPQTYLTRDISCYATPSGDIIGVAIKLNRATQSFTMYEKYNNSSWHVTKQGTYSETIEGDDAVCRLNIECDHLGDVYGVRIHITADEATFISMASQYDTINVPSIE